jgi:prepilin-type N-terminal cleavage/methylation domain-containing protein
MKTRKQGFTIVELLVVVSIIALLIAILLPAIGKARDAARVTQSSANLRNLAVSNDTYSSDWADRQFTAVPDDMGLAQGNSATYNAEIACMPQQLIGYDYLGRLWGYWCGGGMCPGNFPQGCTFQYAYPPLNYSLFNGPSSADIFGSYAMPNNKAFNAYVGERWYDPVFWAPKDTYPMKVAEKYFAFPDEFVTQTSGPQEISYSSYVWSPAAMFSPEVHSRCGFKEPDQPNFPASYRSPAVGQCRFPDLKTRMLEEHWLQNNESDKNPSFENFIECKKAWKFNHGYNSKPVTMFFDGHVSVVGVSDAMEADTRAKKQAENNSTCNNCADSGSCEPGLWVRGSKFGQDGYFGNVSYDTIVDTSYHILTTDGILGRDVIGAK